ncbi:MAG: hypothetical protein F6K41_23135 [Symploca sp. SIO3E6]|nr:hypothetical protein [Caldora sp. SIO3E6]
MNWTRVLRKTVIAFLMVICVLIGFMPASASASSSIVYATWGTNATNLRGQLNKDFTFDCPPNGSIGRVWGSDLYTDDSSICTAAAHSGLITLKDGGEVTIRMLPGASFYTGTASNSISTSSYGNWYGSYRIISARRNLLQRGAMGIGSTSR